MRSLQFQLDGFHRNDGVHRQREVVIHSETSSGVSLAPADAIINVLRVLYHAPASYTHYPRFVAALDHLLGGL